jgi:hypothetical protein
MDVPCEERATALFSPRCAATLVAVGVYHGAILGAQICGIQVELAATLPYLFVVRKCDPELRLLLPSSSVCVDFERKSAAPEVTVFLDVLCDEPPFVGDVDWVRVEDLGDLPISRSLTKLRDLPN